MKMKVRIEGTDQIARNLKAMGAALRRETLVPIISEELEPMAEQMRALAARGTGQMADSVKRDVGRWANNRVENSHLSFRRRERAMLRFRRMKTLQKFASVHANVHNHFNLERHLVDRPTYKDRRSAALAGWRLLAS